jgi:hypothetical protein
MPQRMRSFSWFLAIFGVALFSGCSTRKALLHLPAEQRADVRFIPCTNCLPDVRFESFGAEAARKYSAYGGAIGGLIGYSVAHGIERNNETLRDVRTATGSFEMAAMNEKFAALLERNGLTNAASRDASTLQVRLGRTGLQEMERNRFSAFATAEAQLLKSDGTSVWQARAESAFPDSRPLDDFAKDPALYRRHFEDLAEDLARQLIEGPIRIMTR